MLRRIVFGQIVEPVLGSQQNVAIRVVPLGKLRPPGASIKPQVILHSRSA
jgi:hypothetical protein